MLSAAVETTSRAVLYITFKKQNPAGPSSLIHMTTITTYFICVSKLLN
eukprot:GSA120T00019283001.1